jgi:hypothetical protein
VDRERKLLYLVAVIAPIAQVMAMLDCQEANRTMHRAMAAANDSAECEEHLLRTMVQCHGIRQRHETKIFGTAPDDD